MGDKTAIQEIVITYSFAGTDLVNGFAHFNENDKIYRTVLVKALSYVGDDGNGNITGLDYLYENNCFSSNYTIETNSDYSDRVDSYVKDGYTVLRNELVTYDGWLFNYNEGEGTPNFNISVRTISPFVNYYIQFKYDYKEFDSPAWTGPVYINTTNTLQTNARSIYYILNGMNNNGVLENYFPEGTTGYTQATSILNSGLENSKINVVVKWLVPIEGTPFATRSQASIRVPLYNGKLNLDEVYSALGVKTLDCYDAHLKEFKSESGGVYVAVYYKSSWLKTVTPDGNSFNYFNDFNKSYFEYYHKYVSEKVISEDVYDYMYNTMLTKYPELKPYTTTPENVFGLWGMAVLPESYTIESMWANLFTPTATKGEHVTNFSVTKLMTIEEYNALLKAYEYNWLKIAWNNVGGFLEGMYATHYFFYMQPGTEISWIDQSGQIKDDDDAKEPNQKGAVGGFISGLFQDVGDVFNNAWDLVVGTLKKPVGLTSVLVIAGAGLVAFVLLNKTGGKSGGKRRK